VLSLAALIGIVAAIAFHLKPSDDEAAPVATTPTQPAPEAVTPPATPPAAPADTTKPAPVAATEIQPTLPAEPPKAEPPKVEPTEVTPPPAAPDGKGKDTGEPRPPAAPIAGEVRRPVRPAPPVRVARKEEPGILRVHTTPWSWVTVGNEKQATPAAKFKLAPGHYTVRLNFTTLGITETHHVTIEPTKTFTLNINKDEE
jgi:outer membrane biosynthesis protein TonB